MARGFLQVTSKGSSYLWNTEEAYHNWEHVIIEQESIYARVISLLVSQQDLNFQEVLATELAAYPPSMFQADGQMRVATGKSALKKNLQVEISQRLTTGPTVRVIDVSAVLWTVDWPAHGTVDSFISNFKRWLSRQLSNADVYLCFDRYHDYSIKSSTTKEHNVPSIQAYCDNLTSQNTCCFRKL